MIDEYFALQAKIYAHFGYVEDWKVIPLSDEREYFWRLHGEGPGKVFYADTEEDLNSDGNYYSATIYTQRFLPKWVYRASDYTLICMDTQTDGNKFLGIFDNAKERP